MSHKGTLFVVSHNGAIATAAVAFKASPLAALDAAESGVLILASDANAAMRTFNRAARVRDRSSPLSLNAHQFREGYRSALRDLAAFIRNEIEAVAPPGPHATAETIRNGRHAVLEQVSSWAVAHEPNDPLPYPDKDG